MIPDEQLFRMVEKAFSQPYNERCRVAFIKDMVRRHKAMGEPVCDCLVWLSVVCCVLYGATLFCCYAHDASIFALTQYSMTEIACSFGFA